MVRRKVKPLYYPRRTSRYYVIPLITLLLAFFNISFFIGGGVFYNESVEAPLTSTKAWSNVTTVAWKPARFYSGFRNQMMSFTMFVLDSIKNEHGQIIIESIKMKDTYGSNSHFDFERIWDVSHWNSFYPRLPRLVHADEKIHTHFNATKVDWYWDGENITDRYGLNRIKTFANPHACHKQQSQLFGMYMRYSKGKGTPWDGAKKGDIHPADILMRQGALRPNPKLQRILQNVVDRNIKSDKNWGNDYITLHARVEPDMQAHPVCRQLKVFKLDEIFTSLETTWPEPPAHNLFLPINRESLEHRGYPNEKDPNSTNWIAVNNLKALNDAVSKGLWDGRVKVYELGARVLEGTDYEHISSTTGSALNFFHAINAKIFIGTPVSTYSHDIMTTRFYRNLTENYKYLPAGLEQWTPPGIKRPEGFGC